MIYLIDDDVNFCNVMIENLPYEVKTYQNTTQATMDVFRDHPSLIISDINIPTLTTSFGLSEGTDGVTILALFKVLRPDIPLIAISANSKNEIHEIYEGSKEKLKDIHFFEKPLKDDFYACIDEILKPQNFVFSKFEIEKIKKINPDLNKALRLLIKEYSDKDIEELLKKSNIKSKKF